MQNQKKAIEKHPNLYTAKQERLHRKNIHGYVLNWEKKYGSILGKKRAESLKGNRDYFSLWLKRLQQESQPSQSRSIMLKAHNTMKERNIQHTSKICRT